MATTLSNGVVVPDAADLIPGNGVQAFRDQGASVNSALGNRALVGHTHTWDQIEGKPATFTPAAHTHATADVDGLDSALAGKVDDDDPRLSDARTPTAHTHPVSDVDGLAARLAALEYDTGIRNITAMFPEVTSGSVYLQRTSRAITVALYGVALGGRTGTDSYWHLSKFLPSGFRPAPGALFMIPVIAGTDTVVRFRVVSSGQMTIYSPSSVQQFYGSITFTTNDPAPATLPGTAA